MKILFLKLLMWLQIGFSELLDTIFKLFNVFAGIEEVRASGSENDITLLEYFLYNDSVQAVFWYILIIGVVLTVVFTIVSLVKNMVVSKKTTTQILSKCCGSLVSLVVTVVVLFAFIFGANCVLKEIDYSFNQGSNLTLGQQLLEISIGEDAWQINPETNEKYTLEDIFGIVTDENGTPIKDANGNNIINTSWKGITPDTIFGVLKPNFIGLEQDAIFNEEAGSLENVEFVKPGYVYISEYRFFMGVPAVIIMMVVLFTAIMGLVVRLFDLVFIFLTSPLLVATTVVDDGAKFKLWRETAISKTLIAYCSIFAINIYMLLFPLITKVRVPLDDSGLVNNLMHVLIVICGALTISNGQTFFARLLGTDAQESRQAAHGFRAMFAGVMGTAKAVSGAARLTFGTYNPYTGRRDRGLIGHSRNAVKAVTGGANTLLSGGSEKNSNFNRLGKERNKLSKKLHESWRQTGGLRGIQEKHNSPMEKLRRQSKWRFGKK